MYEMGLACAVSRYGYAHGNTAVYTNLGNINYNQGKRQEALKAQRKELEIRLEVLGPERPNDVCRMTAWVFLSTARASTRRRCGTSDKGFGPTGALPSSSPLLSSF
jgi:hypothetical protein